MVYLTREEVEKLNRGEVPAAQYMKGTLEWNEDYNYYWAPCTGSRVMKEKKVSPQDPAICNYSGLRPVEGYQEEIDKEIKRLVIADLDTEEGKEKAEWFRRGWLAGYDKGLYDGQYKEDIDKEMKIDKGDINFMYKWIRSKSGK